MIHQLRIYEIEPKLKEAFDKRFREHAMRIMHTYGFDIRSMWYSNLPDKTEFIYILRWPDTETMTKQWELFMADPEWDKIKQLSREQHGEMVLGKTKDQVLEEVDWFNNAHN